MMGMASIEQYKCFMLQDLRNIVNSHTPLHAYMWAYVFLNLLHFYHHVALLSIPSLIQQVQL